MTPEQREWAEDRVGGRLDLTPGGKWTIVDYRPDPHQRPGCLFVVQKPGTRDYRDVYRPFPQRLIS